MKIGIIGAGVAGIVSAKILTQFGHDVTVYEKCPDIGGVWSSTRRYPQLALQNSKHTYHLSDLPMPEDYPHWPYSEQVQSYLVDYARSFGVLDKIRTCTEITSAELHEQTPSWELHWHTADGSTGTDRVDHLVVANGVYSQPFMPDFEGKEEFEAAGGRVVPPSALQSETEVAGKNLLIVGYSKSACDLTVALAEAAATTTVVARSLVWKVSRKNLNHLLLTRFGQSLFEYHTTTGWDRFVATSGRRAKGAVIDALAARYQSRYALKELDLVPPGDFSQITRGTASITTDGFFELVSSGDVQVVRESCITKLFVDNGTRKARLSTGEILPVDIVVAATGFTQSVPFFSPEITHRLLDAEGNFALYRHVLPHDVPALTFSGYNSSFMCPTSSEVAALWTASYLSGLHMVPSETDRRAQVARRLSWAEQRAGGRTRGVYVGPFGLHTIDEMCSDMGVDIRAIDKAKQWVLPTNPAAYQVVTQTLLKRAADPTWRPVTPTRCDGPTPQ